MNPYNCNNITEHLDLIKQIVKVVIFYKSSQN